MDAEPLQEISRNRRRSNSECTAVVRNADLEQLEKCNLDSTQSSILRRDRKKSKSFSALDVDCPKVITTSTNGSESIGSGDIPSEANEFLFSHIPNSPSDTFSLSKQLLDDLKSPDTLAPSAGCEMCANYEIRLQQLQEMERSLKQQLTASQHLADRYRTELSAERLFRTELESKMSQLSSEANRQVQDLSSSLTGLNGALERSDSQLDEGLTAVREEFGKIVDGRKLVGENMRKLHAQYAALLGEHRQEAHQMQAEAIALPQNVDELQLLALQLREELIETRAAKNHLEQAQKGEIAALKEQLMAEQVSKAQLEEGLSEEVFGLRTELGISRSHVADSRLQQRHMVDLERQVAELQMTIGDLETKLGSVQREKGELEFGFMETRKRASNLQQELDNSEAVQRDFVKLSQSLQIELEKIRQAEQEVRWQHEDDVLLCTGCRAAFAKGRPKVHCRHCGKVFCETCVTKTVRSGPQNRPARVCDVCHTLLVRDTAPYFSEHVPNSAD